MAKTPVKNIELNKGEDYGVTGCFTDNAGNNVDISGNTYRGEVREYCGGPLLASFTYTVFQDTDGKWKYTREMLQSVINAIPNTSAVWDQFQENPAGLSSKILTGKVKITCNITDPTI